MLERRCLACGGNLRNRYQANVVESRIDEHSYSSRKHPELMHREFNECRSCRTYWSPRESRDQIVKMYETSQHNSVLESQFAARTYLSLIRKELKDIPGQVLDVGCSDGAFLSLVASLGAKSVVGIEPSKDAAMRSVDSRVKILIGGSHDVEPGTDFDVVVLFQTIEHVVDLSDLLQSIRGWLKPSGRFFVVCHNRLSIVNRTLGRRSPIFDIEHFQLFTKKGITLLLESSGFRVDSVRPFTNRYPASYAVQLLLPAIGIHRQVGLGFLRRVSIPFPAGNLFVSATKI